MTSIPKIYRLGERLTQGIFDGPVVIEEKVDGSQFSFTVDSGGTLICRSKTTVIDQNDPGMFAAAVATAQRLHKCKDLLPGVVWQCEYLAKPKHNVLAYSRHPKENLVLFDVKDSFGYLTRESKQAEALRLRLECVPVLFEGVFPLEEQSNPFARFANQHSFLGGCTIEGIVIKNYAKSHAEREGHPLTAKVVSDAFKERATHQPKNPKAHGEPVQQIINTLRTEARWLKAIQHLREAGKLTESNKDIGALIAELRTDLLAEEADFIKAQLFVSFEKEIFNGIVQGFPQYYQKLLASGFSVYQEQQLEKQAA